MHVDLWCYDDASELSKSPCFHLLRVSRCLTTEVACDCISYIHSSTASQRSAAAHSKKGTSLTLAVCAHARCLRSVSIFFCTACLSFIAWFSLVAYFCTTHCRTEIFGLCLVACLALVRCLCPSVHASQVVALSFLPFSYSLLLAAFDLLATPFLRMDLAAFGAWRFSVSP
jgi:hypothetical protein